MVIKHCYFTGKALFENQIFPDKKGGGVCDI